MVTEILSFRQTDIILFCIIDIYYLQGLFSRNLSGHHGEATICTILHNLIHNDVHKLGRVPAQPVGGRLCLVRVRGLAHFVIARQSF